MQVFKACLKVIRQNLFSMAIYTFVFLALMLLLTLFFQPADSAAFEPTRLRMAVILEDDSHPYSRGLADFLRQEAIVVDLPHDQDSLQDALFYRDVSYILYIPVGFGQSFLDGDRLIQLERTILPDSYSSVQMDLLVQRYLNLSALYVDSIPDLAVTELQQRVEQSLSRSGTVRLTGSGDNNRDYRQASYYFTYLAYATLAVMILSVTTIMIVFNQLDLRRRNLCSPVRLFRFNAQLVAGNLVFALLFWLLMMAISWPLGANQLDRTTWMLFGLNALIFTLACLSLSFMISQFIRKRAVMQSVANVVALGTSFISGIFVPLDFLGPSVQLVASFTPTYWYVRAIRDIDRLPDFSRTSLEPVVNSMLIQAGFIIVFLVIALAVIRQKRQAAT